MLNQFTFIGNITREPDGKQITDELFISEFGVAVNHGKNKDGTQKDPSYFNVTTYGNTAMFCQSHLSKGSKVCVSGSIKITKYQKKDGTEGVSVDVSAKSVDGCDSKNDAAKSV